ncbi:MAG: hypothetical protein AAF722_17940 [Cyanobacteria bacterium P01_C01_bin.70]
MDQAAVDFFQLLVQAGAVPGEDFSCDAEQQAYRLNERCHQLLRTAYPEIDWLDFLGDSQAGVKERIQKLHQQLGHDFVDQLIPLMRQRLTALPEDQAAGYVRAILAGVESATGIVLYPFLKNALNLSEQARLEWLLRQEVVAAPGSACLQDLLQAAGATAADYEVHANDVWLTETGWQKLSLVWPGDGDWYAVEVHPRSLDHP